MDIRLVIEQADPPQGHASLEGMDRPVLVNRPFSGWLGLLRALEQLLGEGASGGYPHAARPEGE